MNQKARTWLHLEFGLRMALERGEFMLLYQPQVDIVSGRVITVEALIRWNRDGNIIPPSDFIPLAEETGLINSIGDWVLEAACAQAAIWNADLPVPVRVAVNLSPSQLEKGDFVARVVRILGKTDCKPTWLELEITESCMMRRHELVANTLGALSEMGTTIAIDDFGIGYSSLSYLKEFSIDTIKIDRSFIEGIAVDTNDAAIVRAITALADSLNLNVVAEGVENGEQFAALVDMQCCSIVQGNFFAFAMTADEVGPLLARSYTTRIRDASLERPATGKSPRMAEELVGVVSSCKVEKTRLGGFLCRAAKSGCAFLQPDSSCGHPLIVQLAESGG